MLLLYYSGHVDATNLHLRESSLSWNEFLRMANASPASTKVVVADACRSGELTHVKGVRVMTPFALPEVSGLPRGIAIVTSASAGESAQEFSDLRGSFFTHHFLAALRGAGDLDGDGRITLQEAFLYSSKQTVADTANTTTDVQHATYRYRISGRADLKVQAQTKTEASPSWQPMLMGSGGGSALDGFSGSAGGGVGVGLPVDAFTFDVTLQYLYAHSNEGQLHINQCEFSLQGGVRARVLRLGIVDLSVGPRIGAQFGVQSYNGGAALATRYQWAPSATACCAWMCTSDHSCSSPPKA